MQKALLFKIAIIGFLMVVIAIPLAMIESTIFERLRFRDEAVNSIIADSVGEQTILGPVLVLPYSDSYEVDEVMDGDPKKTIRREHTVERLHYVFPNELRVKTGVDTDQRYRGIHKVLVYSGTHMVSGDFVLPTEEVLRRESPKSRLKLGTPYVALGLEDTRGLHNFPKLVWAGKTFEFKQESRLTRFPKGLHAPIDLTDLSKVENVQFSLDLVLDGVERLSFVPIAKFNQVTIKSKWQHPQFGGRFLPSPKDRSIGKDGFSATWNISALATSAQQQLLEVSSKPAEGTGVAKAASVLDHFSVAFIEPINIYSQAARAVKYGLLFIALTFAAFFLFEILKQLPVHPVQYALVGMSLALFFLLLVSLSEHMHFALAYLSASVACISLIGFYLAHVLRNWRRGFGFGIALSLLYGVLFGLLQSENNALVLGAILLFAVLAAIMVITRKVDWYQLGKAPAKDDALVYD